MVIILIDTGFFVIQRAFRDIYFAADDGLDSGLFRFLVKFNGSVKGAVVGDGERIHFKFCRARDEFVNFRQAVKQ